MLLNSYNMNSIQMFKKINYLPVVCFVIHVYALKKAPVGVCFYNIHYLRKTDTL